MRLFSIIFQIIICSELIVEASDFESPLLQNYNSDYSYRSPWMASDSTSENFSSYSSELTFANDQDSSTSEDDTYSLSEEQDKINDQLSPVAKFTPTYFYPQSFYEFCIERQILPQDCYPIPVIDENDNLIAYAPSYPIIRYQRYLQTFGVIDKPLLSARDLGAPRSSKYDHYYNPNLSQKRKMNRQPRVIRIFTGQSLISNTPPDEKPSLDKNAPEFFPKIS
ncbi:MAG: hypothetical protein IJ730_04295 [Alphaproteobacteria bacterium]|nr:hypothetical protein [Alphaproteobacteria bacterium]